MPTINRLRTIATEVTPIAFDVYDKTSADLILSLLARVIKRRGSFKEANLQWWAAFPELREWIGERETQVVFADKLTIPIKKHEITFAMDRDDIDGDHALVTAAELAEKIGEGFAHGLVNLAYGPLSRNEPTYDGQSMFDLAHEHPTGETFSNILTLGTDLPARAAADAPTVVEAAAEFKAAMRKLQRNRLARKTLILVDTQISPYVVITKSDDVYSAYYDLLTEEKINNNPNRYRNKFTLINDPEANDSSVDFVYAPPNGPRPVVVVRNREPKGLQFDQSKLFGGADIPFGMDGRYGVRAGFPQNALRVTN